MVFYDPMLTLKCCSKQLKIQTWSCPDRRRGVQVVDGVVCGWMTVTVVVVASSRHIDKTTTTTTTTMRTRSGDAATMPGGDLLLLQMHVPVPVPVPLPLLTVAGRTRGWAKFSSRIQQTPWRTSLCWRSAAPPPRSRRNCSCRRGPYTAE